MIVLNFFVNDFERVIIKKSNLFVKNLYFISYFKAKILKILIENSLIDNYESFYLKTIEDKEFVEVSLNLIEKLNEYCKKEKIIFVINYIPVSSILLYLNLTIYFNIIIRAILIKLFTLIQKFINIIFLV